jgi:hypothetical protein
MRTGGRYLGPIPCGSPVWRNREAGLAVSFTQAPGGFESITRYRFCCRNGRHGPERFT